MQKRANIFRKIICTVSQHRLRFYQIQLQHQKQYQKPTNQLVGQISLNQDIQRLFCRHLNLTYPDQALLEKKNIYEQQNKQINFKNPTIIQEKGVVYNHVRKRFYLLVQAQMNKYLLSFDFKFNDFDNNLQNNLGQEEKVRQKQYQNRIEMHNFAILYNFEQPSYQIKYSLQLSPQLLYLQHSETIILMRKFYSDSLVIIFLNKQDQTNQMDQQNQINVEKHFINIISAQNEQNEQKHANYPSQQKHQLSPRLYWQFYINQQCLSSLDDYNYLVNYRQLIVRSSMEMDVIDIKNKLRLNFKINQSIEPMTIKGICSLESLRNIEKYANQQQKLEHFKVRIYSVLRKQQSSYIVDFDLIQGVVLNTYKISGYLLQKVSFSHSNQQFSFINYAHDNIIYLAILKNDLSSLQDQIRSKQFIQQLKKNSFKSRNEQFIWNINFQNILQYSLQFTNQILCLNISKVINKKIHYIQMLNQLRNNQDQYQILHNNQLLTQVYELLTHKNPILQDVQSKF